MKNAYINDLFQKPHSGPPISKGQLKRRTLPPLTRGRVADNKNQFLQLHTNEMIKN